MFLIYLNKTVEIYFFIFHIQFDVINFSMFIIVFYILYFVNNIATYNNYTFPLCSSLFFQGIRYHTHKHASDCAPIRGIQKHSYEHSVEVRDVSSTSCMRRRNLLLVNRTFLLLANKELASLTT